MKRGFVYILTNNYNRVLYTGVTSNLEKRLWAHKNYQKRGFTKKYNITKLVYFEDCGDISNAICREKQIKGGSRQKKIALITSVNPEWKDLAKQCLS
jgi:putative endonuclease